MNVMSPCGESKTLFTKVTCEYRTDEVYVLCCMIDDASVWKLFVKIALEHIVRSHTMTSLMVVPENVIVPAYASKSIIGYVNTLYPLITELLS